MAIFVKQELGGFISPLKPPFARFRILTLEPSQQIPKQRVRSQTTIVLITGAPRETTADSQTETFTNSGDSLMVLPGQDFQVQKGRGETTLLIIVNPDRGPNNDIVIDG